MQKTILVVAAVISAVVAEYGGEGHSEYGGGGGGGDDHGYGDDEGHHRIHTTHSVESKPHPVPVYEKIGVPIPHPVPVAVPHYVKVKIPQPYPVISFFFVYNMKMKFCDLWPIHIQTCVYLHHSKKTRTLCFIEGLANNFVQFFFSLFRFILLYNNQSKCQYTKFELKLLRKKYRIRLKSLIQSKLKSHSPYMY